MTKRFFFAALALCLGAFTCVSCSDDDDKSTAPSSETISKSDLIGTWKDYDKTFVVNITEDNITATNGGAPLYNGPWALNGKTIVAGDKNLDFDLLLGKKLFVNEAEFMYLLKDDARGATTSSDIIGTWYYYFDYNDKEIRSAITFNANGTFELIICAWAEKYVGTYSYGNDVATLNTTAYYSSRNETGEGFGPGTLNPYTLEATWWPSPSYSTFGASQRTLPFIVVGDHAYGPFVGLQAYYYKQ